jgi:glycerol-3-phosphate acyltransferase PlsY
MNETTENTKRPTSITVICVIGFIGALLAIPLVFSSIAQQVGAWYPPYLGFSAVVGLACMVGLWMMMKWAAYTYTGLVALNQIVMLAMGVWNIMALLIPAVVIFFALKHAPRMT